MRRPRCQSAARPASSGINLYCEILRFNKRDGVRLEDLLSGGMLCVGASGSGKSTGIINPLGRSLIEIGCSVVFTTVKPDDTACYAALAGRAGCAEPKVFTIGRDTFNPCAYLQHRIGDPLRSIEPVTQLVLLALRRQSRESGTKDSHFSADAERFVRFVVTIFALARWRVSIRLVYDTLINLPQSREDVGDPGWQQRCPAFAALRDADEHTASQHEIDELQRAAEFLLVTVPGMPHRTRESTVATFCAPTDAQVHGEIGRALSAEHDTWTPDELLDAPGVLIIDAPIQVHGETGAVLQRFILSAIQHAVLSREITEDSPVVVLMCDEYPSFADVRDDVAFARVARSQRGCMVMGTQSIGALVAACGGAMTQRAADALLGMCAVKVFAASTDVETLQFIERTFTQTLQAKVSMTAGSGGGGQKGLFNDGSQSSSVQMDLVPDVPAYQIAQLRRGGPEHGWVVEAFVSMAGRTWWASGRPSLKVAFPQAFY